MDQIRPFPEASRLLMLLGFVAVLLFGAGAYLMQSDGRSESLRALEERLEGRLDRLEQHLPASASSTSS